MQPNKTVAPWKGVGCEAPDLSDTEHVGKLLTEKKETIHPMRLFFTALQSTFNTTYNDLKSLPSGSRSHAEL